MKNVTATHDAGGLAASASYVQYVRNEVEKVDATWSAGGLASGASIVQNTYNKVGRVFAKGSSFCYAGGLIGGVSGFQIRNVVNDVDFVHCHTNSPNYATYAGGLIGRSKEHGRMLIENVVNRVGHIENDASKFTAYTGGLVGHLIAEVAWLDNVYSRTNIFTQAPKLHAGQLIGALEMNKTEPVNIVAENLVVGGTVSPLTDGHEMPPYFLIGSETNGQSPSVVRAFYRAPSDSMAIAPEDSVVAPLFATFDDDSAEAAAAAMSENAPDSGWNTADDALGGEVWKVPMNSPVVPSE